MASSSRFDVSLSNPDGPAYSNGQRGSYSAAPVEKLGGLREGSDRSLSSPFGTSKVNATSSQGDMACLLQSLGSELKAIAADHRLNRPGEIRRTVSSIFGVSANDTSSATFGTKPVPSSCLEDIKRLKNNLQDNFTKARDRVKILGDASLKIDKFCHNIVRKRSRVDSSSGERPTGLNHQGSVSKNGPQSQLSGCVLEIGSQRLEDKAKINVPNRRIRTSLVEANGTSRTSGSLERDKDILKSTNGSAVQADDNERVFSTVVDGWESSRMKKKRSIIKSDVSASSGLVNSQCDRENKRGMQQKIGIDTRQKLNYSHSFRSGSNNGTTLAGKIDSSTQQNAPGMRTRNEQNHVSVPNDRRDTRFCSDTDSSSLRVIPKPNSREDTRAASPTLPKFGSARGPRSNSGSLSKTSPNVHRVAGNLDDMEPPHTIGVINRKRSASVRSSSPPVGQWAVQRPQKISRSSRRSSLSPLISTQDEPSIAEPVDGSINHDDLGGNRRASLNASQHNKMRVDTFASASLSESEESVVQENMLKDKVKKCADIECKPAQTVRKFTNIVMPSRNNRMAVDEDCGDADRRQGRIRRGFASARSAMPATIENFSDVITTKQQRSARHGSERVESKLGRPPIKKLSERKSYARPRQLINNVSLESSDEAADDHEELVAAATAAIDTGRRCSGPFWKQAEPAFSFVSVEDTAFLREQIDQDRVLMSSATAITSRCESNAFSNGVNVYGCERETAVMKETTNPLLEQSAPQSGSHSGISICQALISAIIEEDDMDKLLHPIDYGEPYSCIDSYAARFELDKDLKPKEEDCQTLGRKLDYYKADVNQRFSDEISREMSGTNGVLETVNRPNQTTTFSSDCNEFSYDQMSINDRLILELSSIGLYLETMPDLTFGEDEDIMKAIHTLEDNLHEQASNRKKSLRKLEKAVVDANELQQRKLERLTMDRLVQMAYDRYMSCWGPGTSGSKNVNKFAKHAAQTFIKRTLARCKKFEETDISCFHEPAFKDIFLSAFSRSNDFQITNLPPKASQTTRTVDTHAKSSNTARSSLNPLLEQNPLSKEETWLNRIKKKEVLLDDVVGNTSGPSSQTPPGIGSSLVSGAKGKRSERDRDGKGHNRDLVFKNTTAKIGRPSSSSSKGERKNKTKPKVKTAHFSASVDVLHNQANDISGRALSFPPTSGSAVRDAKEKEDLNSLPGAETKQLLNENDPIDLSSLPIPDMDVVDFGGQAQDIASWLNFEEEGMQDQDDFMGLEIPMDDLSDVHMMI